MARTLLLMLLVLILVACTSSGTGTATFALPVSDTKPTLLIFCNNAEVSCTDLGYITEQMTETFGEDIISIAYVFVDSVIGLRFFETLELSEIPSFVIFSPEDGEVFRTSGEVNIDEWSGYIADILND